MTTETMLAARYDRNGPAAEVLRLEQVARPDPGPGEVRVRLVVSGVNPTDWKQRSGLTAAVSGTRGTHEDGAGTIDAVGDGVESTRIGERVWVYLASTGSGFGTAAQWTIVPSPRAVPLPDAASFDLGASIGVPAITAHRCLFVDGPIAGQDVLVAGGAGAVGRAAIQLARAGGARVIATVSSDEKATLASDAGADAVVNYRSATAADEIRAASPDGIDRVIEVALAANLELDLEVCKPEAVAVVYADTGPLVTGIGVRKLMTKNLVLRFVALFALRPEAMHEGASVVAQAVSAGVLTPLPFHRFGLEQVVEAQQAVEAGATGKVLVDIP